MLVNLPRSRLATKWKRDLIHDWAKRLDTPPKRYEPSQEVLRNLDNTILPGDRCGNCKKAVARYVYPRNLKMLRYHVVLIIFAVGKTH